MSTFPNLPPALIGWRWATTTIGDVELQHPEGAYTTKSYAQPKRAISDALRWLERHSKALMVAEPAVEGIVVMTREEARRAADAIKAAVEDLRVKIDEFDQGRGWKVLGYESFREWAAAEIPDTSLRHVYRLRDAAEVDRSLGVTIGHTPESHARELKHVPSEERPAVLRQADEQAAAED